MDVAPLWERVRKLRHRIKWTAGYIAGWLGGKPAMVTLTYREGQAWKPEQVKELLRHMRQWMKRRGFPFRYVWVCELQQRGAPHYHVVIWLPRGVTLPKPDKQGWWPHGHTRIEWARKPVGYLMKYTSKLVSKGSGFPKGLRLHGSGGLDDQGQSHRAWRFLPDWIRCQTAPFLNITRAKGGGFLSRVSGEFWESPWRVTGWTFVPGVGRVISIERAWSDK